MREKKVNYVDNRKFYETIIEHRKRVEENVQKGLEQPRLPEYIGECIWKIANKLSNKPCFINYSYKDEMISDGIENCFHRSTKILTIEHGPVAIGDIVGKDVTIKCKDGIWRKSTVKSYGRQRLYEYGFGARNKRNVNITQTVICTSNHRWFVQCRLNNRKMFNWKKEVVTDLKIGDMLDTADYVTIKETDAIVHGLLFGDGSVNGKTTYSDGVITRQGRDYAFMRVCKQDKVRNEIIQLIDSKGYKCTYPKSAKGDPVYYFGRFPHCKEVPFTYDPSYIAGFIYGWWLADGSKTDYNGHYTISTINKDAAEWLRENCAYAGYHCTSFRIKKPNLSSYPNAKESYIIGLQHDSTYKPRVKYVKEYGEDEVFCLEEPVTSGFVLANGLLTGNCIMYFKDFDPKKSQNPFAYFTQIIYYAFLRRISKEEKNRYIIYKNFQESIVNQGKAAVLMDSENNSIVPTQMYDNINDFMAKFEKKEEIKKQKRKEQKLGLTKFYEEEKDESRSSISS